ncbi:hypothetical protein HTZ85_15525 [Escherichia coli]|nr:hypothetical protein [Escherichia coli]
MPTTIAEVVVLPAPFGPQQTDNFPGVDGQADVFYHATAFIGFARFFAVNVAITN